MSLVPRGPHRGKVLVWDIRGRDVVAQDEQRWSLLDVSAGVPVFQNAELELPRGGGDFFCAGHAWTSTGQLFVAGGTALYPGDEPGGRHGGIVGGRLAYLWDPAPAGPATPPAMGRWERLADLTCDRWYPSVLLLASGDVLVAGGIGRQGEPHINDYEVYTRAELARSPHAQPAEPRSRLAGPAAPASPFHLYPRLHQLATGEQLSAGMGGASARMDHAASPGAWSFTDVSIWPLRNYVCSVRLPVPFGAREIVMNIGGEGFDGGGSLGVHATVETCATSGPQAWNWRTRPSLSIARARANAVLLPDRGVLVIGGEAQPSGTQQIPVTAPELLAGDDTGWRVLAPAASARGYHATAVLLPDGRVLTGGGDTAKWDYQVFVPPYLLTGRPRPVVTAAPAQLPYGTANPAWQTLHFAAFPPGEELSHVTLLAPGSVTHSFDASQRYVELELGARTATSVELRGPLDAASAPPGYYMLFVVSAAGVPSLAEWVEVR